MHFPEDERPKSALIFWTFRIMVAIGFAMLGIGLWSAWARWKGRLLRGQMAAPRRRGDGAVGLSRRALRLDHHRGRPSALHRLRPAAHKRKCAPLQAEAVGASLIAFIVVYFFVFGSGTFYVLRLMGKRPKDRIDIDQIGPTRAAGITPVAAIRTAPQSTAGEQS